MPQPKLSEMTTEQKIVEYATLTSASLEKAAAFYQQKQATDAAVADRIPAVVKAMVDHQRIEPGQAEKLAQALADPAKALDILLKVAGHRNDAEVAAEQTRLGRPQGDAATVKTGGARQPFTGQRNPGHAGSDLALLQALNIAPQ